MTIQVLMVAEKPILAESIAKLLSNSKHKSRKGFNGACSIHEYSGEFYGKQANFKVTSTCGHVFGLDFPERYNNWERIDPVELFDCPTDKKEANPKLKMVKYLSSEANGCDYLVLWLDCDKEGENICFEVINSVKSSMKKNFSKDFMENVYRAHFSAITEKEIKNAMKNLVKPNLNESLSVDSRQELDLRVGCAFTRFQTRYFQNKYGDLDSTCISFGPCQTPTLNFCVKRHDQIVQFTPESYWVLQLVIDGPSGRPVKVDWTRERIFDKDVATVFLNRVKGKESVLLSSITSKENRKEKPAALNTVELLRIASSSLGMGPSQTMSVAEHLYTHGYISYPRTETTAYPSSFDFISLVKQQSTTGRFSTLAKEILDEGLSKPKSGEDKGDHPPITPMKADNGYLSGDQLRIYEYITQHFLATIMKPCKYITSTCKFTIDSEIFTLQSRKVIDPGFTKVMTWQAVNEEENFINFKQNESYKINNVSLTERQTSPPDYLTESELITLMEKYGIGTDASIPVHISNIVQRNYVTVESGRKLIPTKLGIALIHGYSRIDSELILPTMRSEIETQLNLIAKGKADYEAVTKHALKMFKMKFQYFLNNINQIDGLFEDSFTKLADTGKPFSRCGKCKRFMKLVQSKPQRLYCPICQETLNLPTGRDGNIRIHGENTCPLDGFDLLYWNAAGGKLADSWSFCPYCYNNPPFEDMKQGLGCNKCTHPTCKHGFIQQSICQCLNGCNNGKGYLVLDPQSGPKWRFACNYCPSVITVFEGATRLKLLDKECSECGGKQIFAEYLKKTKLPNDETKFTGCIFCSKEELGDLVNMNHAQLNEATQRVTKSFGRRGGGRGRGSRGRGGGRGRGTRGGRRGAQ